MHLTDVKVGLLMFFSGSDHIYAVLMNQEGGCRDYRLQSWKTILPRVDRFFEKMERGALVFPNRSPPELEEFAFGWGKTLLPPIEALAFFDVLIILPHYTINGLPFHAIWLDEVKQYAGTRWGMSYCSSATLFTRCVNRNPARMTDPAQWRFALDSADEIRAPAAPATCLAIGADIIGDQTPLYQELAQNFASRFAEPVPVQPPKPPVPRFPEATRSRIKLALEGYRDCEVFCIACHGYYDPMAPEGSGLLLQKPIGFFGIPKRLHGNTYHSFRDLPFKPIPPEITPGMEAEFMALSEMRIFSRTQAQLAALFGCSTAAGQIVSGEEFNSMAYEWLKVGAASVLANGWEFDIRFASHWCPLFLDNWIVKRQPKALAWRESLKLILAEEPAVSMYEWG